MLGTFFAVTAFFFRGDGEDENSWSQPLNAKSAAHDEPCTIDYVHCDGSEAQHL